MSLKGMLAGDREVSQLRIMNKSNFFGLRHAKHSQSSLPFPGRFGR